MTCPKCKGFAGRVGKANLIFCARCLTGFYFDFDRKELKNDKSDNQPRPHRHAESLERERAR
jgi:hypothetical protein